MDTSLCIYLLTYCMITTQRVISPAREQSAAAHPIPSARMGKPKKRPQGDGETGLQVPDGGGTGGGGQSSSPDPSPGPGTKKRRTDRGKQGQPQQRGGRGRGRGRGGQRWDLTVRVTRVLLEDDHTHAPAPGPPPPPEPAPAPASAEAEGAPSPAGDREPAVVVVAAAAAAAERPPSDPPSPPSPSPFPPPRQPSIRVVHTRSARRSPGRRYSDGGDGTYVPLPGGDCGDGIRNPHPPDAVPDKYWAQRRRLFSRYDEGILLDRESWYSVTPEAIAAHTARRVGALVGRWLHPPAAKEEEGTTGGGGGEGEGGVGGVGGEGGGEKVGRGGEGGEGEGEGEGKGKGERGEGGGVVVLDAFCGCGGNGIAFALRPPGEVALVVCVDLDRSKLEMAAANAAIYGVGGDRIVFVEGDAVAVMEGYHAADGRRPVKGPPAPGVGGSAERVAGGYRMGGPDLLPPLIDAVFLSPPWGGTDYRSAGKKGYDIERCIRLPQAAGGGGDGGRVVNGAELLSIAGRASAGGIVAYFLPRNTNLVSLGQAARRAGYCGSIELEQNFLNGKFKTTTAFLSGRESSQK